VSLRGGVLRARQKITIQKVRSFLELGKKRGKIVMSTGIGKTVLFTKIIEALNIETIVLAPTKTIINQTEEKMEEFASDLDVGKIYTSVKNYGKQVSITTIQSLQIGMANGKINYQKDKLLIVDEAHMFLSPSYKAMIDSFELAGGIVLEFTATPKYSETKQVTSETIDELSVKEAIEENLLASLACILAKTKVDLSKVSINNGEYNVEEFENELKKAGLIKACIEMHKQGFKGKNAVVFVGSVAMARDVQKEFDKEFGINFAKCYTGEETEREQAKIKSQYDNVDTNTEILAGVDLLTTGFDSQRATVCYNLIPTKSLPRATQRDGRVLRVDISNADKHAYVVDFIYEDDRKNGKGNITFAEVVGQSVVLSKVKIKGEEEQFEGDAGNVWEGDDEDGGGDTDWPTPELPVFTIKGLEVITDSDEIMRVVGQMRENGEKKVFDFEKFQAEVRLYLPKIMSEQNYTDVYSQNKWRSPNYLKKQPEWQEWITNGKKPWSEFLGKKVFDMEEFQSEVMANGVNSVVDYQKIYSKKGWMSTETLAKKIKWQEWISEGKNPWDEFLGRESKKTKNFEQSQREAKGLSVASSKAYIRLARENNWIRYQPLTREDSWKMWIAQGKNPWDEFLGRNKK
jgi:superfamily II DNA or RNA helicase